jgi:hypothetical protein
MVKNSIGTFVSLNEMPLELIEICHWEKSWPSFARGVGATIPNTASIEGALAEAYGQDLRQC